MSDSKCMSRMSLKDTPPLRRKEPQITKRKTELNRLSLRDWGRLIFRNIVHQIFAWHVVYDLLNIVMGEVTRSIGTYSISRVHV